MLLNGVPESLTGSVVALLCRSGLTIGDIVTQLYLLIAMGVIGINPSPQALPSHRGWWRNTIIRNQEDTINE